MQPKFTRRAAIGLAVLAGTKSVAQDAARFPPVPAWRPSFWPPLETIVDRIHYYFDGLAESEVLFATLGQNKFDDFGNLALLGRCYMFMDAQDPQVVLVERARA